MPIIDESALDPVQAGGKIITEADLDPVAKPALTMGGKPLPDYMRPGAMSGAQILQQPGMLGDFTRGMVNQLPLAGQVGGAALGSLAGVGIMSPILGVAGGVGGGALGEATKGLINESLGLTPPKSVMENWSNIAKSGAIGGITEMGGPIIAKGIQKITSPFAAGVEARMAADPSIKAAQELVEKGAPISPEVIAGTKTARFFDWMAEKMWPANSVMARGSNILGVEGRQGLQAVANGLKDEFVATRGLYNTSKGSVDAAWKKWAEMAGGKEAQYAMPETTRLLQDYQTKAVGKFGTLWKQHVPAFMESSTKSVLSKEEANAIQAEIANLNQSVTGQVPPDIFSVLKKEMLENKLAGGNAGQTYSVQAIRDLFNVLNPTSVKGAQRTARIELANAIMSDLSKSGNEEMVKALSEARELGRLQKIAAPLQRIFENSMIKPTKAGEEVIFNPANFVNNWNHRKTSFLENKNYSPEDIKIIDAFAAKMKALVPDLAMAAKEAPPTLSIQGALTNPLAIGATAIKYPGILVPAGIDAMMANSLMKPEGILRKFLTTGFTPPTLSAKVGLMEVMQALQGGSNGPSAD